MTAGYDEAGNLRSIDVDGTVIVERIAHDALGHRTLVAFANGVLERRAFDDRTGRLRRLRAERFTQPAPLTYRPTGAPPLLDVGHAYDLVGNVTAIRHRWPGCGTGPLPDALTRRLRL